MLNLTNRRTRLFPFLFFAVIAIMAVAAPGYTDKSAVPDNRTVPNDTDRIKVACIGNSITYGYLIEEREKNSYPSQLQAILGEGYEVGNFGKNGATLLFNGHRPYVEQPEFHDALDFEPDIAVLHLGVNDTDPRNFPHYGDRFVTDYIALIDSFRNKNANLRIIIANLSPLLSSHPRYRSGTRAWRDSIRSLIPIVAEVTGGELIDFGEILRDHPELLPDAIHPDARGAALLASEVASAITGYYGGLKLPPLFTDGMVLQRNRPLRMKGTANAGDTVTVRLGGIVAETVSDNRGHWLATLPPFKEATGLEMTVTAPGDTVTFNDIAVGEVWIASGQSNMEFNMASTSTYGEDCVKGNDPLLRFFDMKPVAYTNPGEWTDAQKLLTDELHYFAPALWQESTLQNVGAFPAVAWYFGRALRDSLNVPVGIISNAVGGSPAEAWIDIETLEHVMPEILDSWRTNDYLQPWVQGRIAENTGNADERHRHPYEPSYLYSAAIRPIEEYNVAGTIWYQGESNAHNIEVHEQLFPVLVAGWRNAFRSADMPFLFVQLSSLDRPSWPLFRDSQRRLAETVPGTAMVVSSDHGDSLDVHPRNKRPIGERLAQQALNRVYGYHGLVPEGPAIKRAVIQGNQGQGHEGKVVLEFDYDEGLGTSDGQPPCTFELAESEGLYYSADSVEITSDNKLILRSDKVANPRIVRYGWQPFTRANLVNGAGLPASTFKIVIDGK